MTGVLEERYYFALDEKGKALESVDKCLELDRQNGMAWAVRAKVLSESHGRSSEALKAAIHAVALDAGGTELVMLKSDSIGSERRGCKVRRGLGKEPCKAPYRWSPKGCNRKSQLTTRAPYRSLGCLEFNAE